MSKLHCWESKIDWIEQTYGDKSDQYYEYMASLVPSGTCLLPSGHDGPHAWTDDEEIVVRFK